ncbi:MAG: glycoside hydrolase family 3 N-terminal domain-containing protein [Wenzhouxiangella sp.]
MTQEPSNQSGADRIADLLARMSLEEKIGQMVLAQPGEGPVAESLGPGIRAGKIGSVVNVVDRDTVDELQRIATEDSPLGIPLLIGRDVIHGFRTVMPIPLAQAAGWNPALVAAAARCAATEAAAAGINWTFAPMMDIARDPRWGRIAESFGEDVFLACRMAAAMVDGFQGEDLSAPGSIAACAKHFAGYGAVESGRDYASTHIPANELHNVYLPPFKAAVDRGVASLMTSFSDLDGIPATAHDGLLRDLLRGQWAFGGFVVSDWDSIPQLSVHGLTADDRSAAITAVNAGVDMEMASDTYARFLADAVRSGEVAEARIDEAVGRILRIKLDLGLFDQPCKAVAQDPARLGQQALDVAYQSALQGTVLLQNRGDSLPLDAAALNSLAVIGPLADAPYEQLGTWIFDGDPGLSVTVLAGIRDRVGAAVDIVHVPALATSRSRDRQGFEEALAAACRADATVLVLGEESILSGEAHCRADIDLPGAQSELVHHLRASGKPLIAVILAGRPLTLSNIVEHVDAILYAWHPGSMGGAAIADLLLGVATPSGKLPVTFPRAVGQIPLYYNARNTGKPPRPDTVVHIDDIPVAAPQTSLGMSAFHLDVDYTPLFAFGHGLSYTRFEYAGLRLSDQRLRPGETLTVSVALSNRGRLRAEEVVQLYVRDPVASITRPVRELKGFQRVCLDAGQTVRVEFHLVAEDLAFYGRRQQRVIESGRFAVWVGGSSEARLSSEFELVDC